MILNKKFSLKETAEIELEEDIVRNEELNPIIFTNNKLKTEIRESALKVVEEFLAILADYGVKIEVEDVILTGSNASYNYSKDSDIDIHIIANTEKYNCPDNLYPLLYDAYKSLFNKKFDISFYGIPVEIYVETNNTPLVSNGIYSILKNEWVKEPELQDIPEVNEEEIAKAVEPWEKECLDLMQDIAEGKITDELAIDAYIGKLYELRHKGLSTTGEYSIGNLVFKEIRNKEYLDKLKDLKNELIAARLSLKENLKLKESEIIVNNLKLSKNGKTLLKANKDIVNAIIPDSVTKISNDAFHNCFSLKSITIPDSVTSIGSSAFSSCSSLTSIVIPDSVTSIGSWVFFGCSSLTSITIGNSVTSIGSWAFSYCSSLTSITIPDSVTSIGGSAFRECTSLTSITIPNSVTSINKDAFRDCHSLTSINIPKSVTIIGDDAFNYCSRLTSINIPDSVTSIGVQAFFSCTSLTSINIPNGVTSIGNNTFSYCKSLTSIVIPNSVTLIDVGAFYNCSSLKSITIPDSVTSIGSSAFFGCKSLTSINIPDSVTSISNNAFSYCYSLTSVTIGNSVTLIDDYAFSYCTSLTLVKISNSNTIIKPNAFEGCKNLVKTKDLFKELIKKYFSSPVSNSKGFFSSTLKQNSDLGSFKAKYLFIIAISLKQNIAAQEIKDWLIQNGETVESLKKFTTEFLKRPDEVKDLKDELIAAHLLLK